MIKLEQKLNSTIKSVFPKDPVGNATIIFNGDQYVLQSQYLELYSEYFKRLFKPIYCLTKVEIQSDEIDKDIFNKVVSYMYGNTIIIQIQEIQKYLIVFKFLEMHTTIKQVDQLFCDVLFELDQANIFKFLDFAIESNFRKCIPKYIDKIIAGIAINSNIIKQMPFNNLRPHNFNKILPMLFFQQLAMFDESKRKDIEDIINQIIIYYVHQVFQDNIELKQNEFKIYFEREVKVQFKRNKEKKKEQQQQQVNLEKSLKDNEDQKKKMHKIESEIGQIQKQFKIISQKDPALSLQLTQQQSQSSNSPSKKISQANSNNNCNNGTDKPNEDEKEDDSNNTIKNNTNSKKNKNNFNNQQQQQGQQSQHQQGNKKKKEADSSQNSINNFSSSGQQSGSANSGGQTQDQNFNLWRKKNNSYNQPSYQQQSQNQSTQQFVQQQQQFINNANNQVQQQQNSITQQGTQNKLLFQFSQNENCQQLFQQQQQKIETYEDLIVKKNEIQLKDYELLIKKIKSQYQNNINSQSDFILRLIYDGCKNNFKISNLIESIHGKQGLVFLFQSIEGEKQFGYFFQKLIDENLIVQDDKAFFFTLNSFQSFDINQNAKIMQIIDNSQIIFGEKDLIILDEGNKNVCTFQIPTSFNCSKDLINNLPFNNSKEFNLSQLYVFELNSI